MNERIKQIDFYMRRLFPLNRSLTGEGNRETLRILQEIAPINVIEYPSGTKVGDWMVPDEWNVREAWIKDHHEGYTYVDFANNNLHLMGYSEPIDEVMSLDELFPHLHFARDKKAIPYRTSYYQRDWAFCLAREPYQWSFPEQASYHVYIDATLEPGSMTVGEIIIPGKSEQEYLISTYICHPSMANDNLSGVVMTAFLAKELMKMDLNYTYRIVFVPETIGAIAYMAHNKRAMNKIDCGLVVTCVGGVGGKGVAISFKESFDPAHWINRVVNQVWTNDYRDGPFRYMSYRSFDCHGSDERQYSSPRFRINMASVSSRRYYEYPEYHTSLDNLEFVSMERINEMLDLHLKIIGEMDSVLPIIPKGGPLAGEPFLTGRGLADVSKEDMDVILWYYHLADRQHTTLDIAEKVGRPVSEVYEILEMKGLI